MQMKPLITGPKGHRDPNILTYKHLHKFDAHTKPLNLLANQMSDECPARVPYFDPFDGGIKAKLLFVLQSPVHGAEESCFVSRDNDDTSAGNTYFIFDQAGMPREETALWNIVPWYARPPFKKADLKRGATCLARVLPLFRRQCQTKSA